LKLQLRKEGENFISAIDLKGKIKELIKDICELTGLSPDDSLVLLNHFRWRKELLEEKWFGNEESIRPEAGIILSSPKKPHISETLCALCMASHPTKETEILQCQHTFCQNCLRQYINNKVNLPFCVLT